MGQHSKQFPRTPHSATRVMAPASTYAPASVVAVADTIGAPRPSDEAAKALASDVEYRLRTIIQDAIKIMRHCKRETLRAEVRERWRDAVSAVNDARRACATAREVWRDARGRRVRTRRLTGMNATSSAQDVNAALKLRNCEPLYGFGTGTSSVQYKRTKEDPEVFYLDEREIDVRELITKRLPRPPVDVNLVPHWLAVEGVQPMIPENPMPLAPEPKPLQPPLGSKRPRARAEGEGDPDAGGVQPVVSHVLTKELQYYFDKVTALVRGAGRAEASDRDVDLLARALRSLGEDVGLHNLMPYFTQFITEETTASLRDLPRLRVLIQMIRALISNPDINVELYLHQLMPSVVTCVVAKRLCQNLDEDHWSLRDDAANTVAFVCAKFGAAYPSIQPRITRTLLRALLDTKPLTTHYGAVRGLQALGPKVVRETIMPNLRAYMTNTLEPALEAPKPLDDSELKNASEEDRNIAVAKAKLAVLRHTDAQRVMGALQEAVGACLRDEIGDAENAAREKRLADQLMRWHRIDGAGRFEKDETATGKDAPAKKTPVSPNSPSRQGRGATAKGAKSAVVPKAAPLVRGRRTRGTTPDDDIGDAAAAHAPNVAVAETHV